jgi:hypothetical protein
MSKQLHIVNEESHLTTFRSSRDTSNIDVTIINSQLLSTVVEWEIRDQESCSDHSIIRYTIGHRSAQRTGFDFREVKYKVTKEDKEKFQRSLIRSAEQKLSVTNTLGETETLDKILCTRVTKELVIEKSVEELYEVLESACKNSFKILRGTKTALFHKTVRWWSRELKAVRKGLNALRCRYFFFE